MSKATSVVITDQLSDFIDTQVARGNYGSSSEVVTAGLLLLAERQAKLETLRAALIEGEESGEPEPFDFDEFIARKKRK